MHDPNTPFSDPEKTGLYRAIHERRDVRSQFLPDPVPPQVLFRVLDAAHHAPSVGFMQPWDFLVIDSLDVRRQIHGIFTRENEKGARQFTGERQQRYRSLKLEGILESPLNLCITCDCSRGDGPVLGLPEHVYPLAYLCIGYVSEFLGEPALARKGWRRRLPLAELVHGSGWGQGPADGELCKILEGPCPR